MEIKSKFRKLFWVRVGIGILLFIFTLYLCLNSLSQYSQLSRNPLFIVSLGFLLLFLIAGLNLFAVFKLVVTDIGIEKIYIISGRKNYIPFTDIISIKRERIRMRTKSGYLTDGYCANILVLKNNKVLVVSPDNFENCKDIMTAIRSKI